MNQRRIMNAEVYRQIDPNQTIDQEEKQGAKAPVLSVLGRVFVLNGVGRGVLPGDGALVSAA